MSRHAAVEGNHAGDLAGQVQTKPVREGGAFGKTGELINQYFQKGKPIFIEGRIKYDSWEDKQGGGKRSKISVVIENFQFVGGRDGGAPGGGGPPSEGGEAPRQSRPPAARPPQGGRPSQPHPQSAPAEAPYGEEQHYKEDDIPF